jgi:hypothetical protein
MVRSFEKAAAGSTLFAKELCTSLRTWRLCVRKSRFTQSRKDRKGGKKGKELFSAFALSQ